MVSSIFSTLGKIIEKIIDWLISLRIKPTIKVVYFQINDILLTNKQRVIFSVILSNNSNRTMSISEKYLNFYLHKTFIKRLPVVKYDLVQINNGLDKLNILKPLDDIITIPVGESRKISFDKESDGLSLATRFAFTYYSGRKTYSHKIKQTKQFE